MSIQMYPSNYHEIEDVREPVEFFDSNDYMIESGYFKDAEGWYRMTPGYPTNDFPRAMIQEWEIFFECKLHDEDAGGYCFDGTAKELRQFLRTTTLRSIHASSLEILSGYLTDNNIAGFCLRG